VNQTGFKGSKTPALLFLALLLITIIAPLAMGEVVTREVKTFSDKENDVLADQKKGPLNRLMDLRNLDGDKAEIAEKINIDIRSLTIIEIGNYASYILAVEGKILIDSNYTYYVCGYSRTDPEEAETFDFIISYSGGEASYETWQEGKYVRGANVSLIKIEGATLNLTMHRENFILGARTDPFLICGIVVMSTGEGQDRYIDYITTKKKDDSPAIDNDTWMIIQVGFIGFLVITLLILWNFWAKKKADIEQEGGVCPKCEAKLDKNLDFCPHCGSFIRGPQADKENPKPRIVSPLDLETEE
jgi:hypothetical protein